MRTLIVTLTVLFVSNIASAQSWDLNADFSTASNPNGAWRYGSTTSLGGFSSYSDNVAVNTAYANGGFSNIDGWSNGGSGFPFVAKNNSSNIVTSVFQGDWKPGQIVMSPGIGGVFTVARWVSPVSAPNVSLFAKFRRIEGSSSVSSFFVLKNGVTLSSGTVFGFNTTGLYEAPISVAAGDTLDFIVGDGADGQPNTDGMEVNATVTVVPEPATMIALGAGILAVGKRRKRA
jgi:hypothetical protein